jgi:hypothetical protein
MALIVVALLVAVTTLAALGRSVSELISLGVTIIGAMVYAEIRAVREQTNAVREQANGSQAQLIDALRHTAIYANLRPAASTPEDPHNPEAR